MRPTAVAADGPFPVGRRQPVAVFDLDGTLVDTAPDLAGSLNHCLRLAGLAETSVERIRPLAGKGARAMLIEAYRWAGVEPSPEVLTQQFECFLAYYADHIAVSSRPYPGAVEALGRLDKAGFRLVICTNKTERLARLLLKELQLDGRFVAICGADTFAGRKPDPVHLLGSITAAGGYPIDSVMIGDSDTDLEAAERIGIPSVLVAFGYDGDDQARSKATRVIEHFDELTPALLNSVFPASHPLAAE